MKTNILEYVNILIIEIPGSSGKWNSFVGYSLLPLSKEIKADYDKLNCVTVS